METISGIYLRSSGKIIWENREIHLRYITGAIIGIGICRPTIYCLLGFYAEANKIPHPWGQGATWCGIQALSSHHYIYLGIWSYKLAQLQTQWH